ncbi:MAG: oligosaccharide flippase family protein [Moorea sp. SIO3H5]|nr:oligosaccharide flippase family protein [Moorena sp. SIO3H5]
MRVWSGQSLLIYCKKLVNGSTNSKIFRAIVTVGLLTAFVKVSSLIKELVVAWRFGTGDELDAFFIALLVVFLIKNVIAESLDTAFIPTYIRVRDQEGMAAAQKLFSGVMIWALVLLSFTTIVMVATALVYLPLIASGFNPEKLELTFHLLGLMAPVVILTGIAIIWSAVLNAGERFALAALCPMMIPVISILLIVGFKSLGIFALVAGLISGTALELIILGIALHHQGISLLPRWYGFNEPMRQVASQYLPMIAGALLICSAAPIDQAMAAMLSPGSVSILNYANGLIASPINLMSIAISTAVIPYFSKMVASQDWQEIRGTLRYYLRLIFLITVPLSIILIVFSYPIVQVVFERGSFTSDATNLVAQTQAIYALQIPFYIANILVVRLVSAMRLNYILMWVSGFDLAINIILNILFMQWLGIKGIALSTSCVYIFCFSFMFLFTQNQIKKKNPGKQLCD